MLRALALLAPVVFLLTACGPKALGAGDSVWRCPPKPSVCDDKAPR